MNKKKIIPSNSLENNNSRNNSINELRSRKNSRNDSIDSNKNKNKVRRNSKINSIDIKNRRRSMPLRQNSNRNKKHRHSVTTGSNLREVTTFNNIDDKKKENINNNKKNKKKNPFIKRSNSIILNNNNNNNNQKVEEMRENAVIDRAQESILNMPGPEIKKLSYFKRQFLRVEPGATLIHQNIVIGSQEDAKDIQLLQEFGITHILNCANRVKNYFPLRFIYLNINVENDDEIKEYINIISEYINRIELKSGRVLIHDISGISSAVAIAILYILINHKLSLSLIYNHIIRYRPQIRINESFRYQLAKIEIENLKYSSVVRDPNRAWDFYNWNKEKPLYYSIEKKETEFCLIL